MARNKSRQPRRYQFLGWIIEKGLAGWHVLDWDYETENLMHTARTESAALDWAAAHS